MITRKFTLSVFSLLLSLRNFRKRKMIRIFSLIILLLYGCHTTSNDTQHKMPTPTAVGENASVVNAVVLEVQRMDSLAFTLKVRVDSVSEARSLPSIAIAGEKYVLKPAYALDKDGILLNNSRNAGLLRLRKLKKNDRVKLEISFNGSEWLINRNLKEGE